MENVRLAESGKWKEKKWREKEQEKKSGSLNRSAPLVLCSAWPVSLVARRQETQTACQVFHKTVFEAAGHKFQSQHVVFICLQHLSLTPWCGLLVCQSVFSPPWKELLPSRWFSSSFSYNFVITWMLTCCSIDILSDLGGDFTNWSNNNFTTHWCRPVTKVVRSSVLASNRRTLTQQTSRV